MFFLSDFLAADLQVVTSRHGAVDITFTINNTDTSWLSKYDIRDWRDGCGLSWTEIDNVIWTETDNDMLHNNGEGRQQLQWCRVNPAVLLNKALKTT